MIEFFEEHYYVPVLEALNREVVRNKIADLIKEPSEIDFLNELRSASNKFEVDWWLFSKLVERKDNIYIPYLDKDDQEARFILISYSGSRKATDIWSFLLIQKALNTLMQKER